MDTYTVTLRRRTRKTRPSVILLDRVSRGIITIGGIGIILAISLVFVFLASVVVPLFLKGSLTFQNTAFLGTLSFPQEGTNSQLLELSPSHGLGIQGLWNERYVRSFFLPTGQPLNEYLLFDQAPTAFRYDRETGSFVAGFKDGSTQVGKISFHSQYLEGTQLKEREGNVPVGEPFLWEGKVVEQTQDGQLRVEELLVEVDKPIWSVHRKPIIRIDLVDSPNGPVLAGYYSNGVLFVRTVKKKTNLLTGEERREVEEKDLQVPLSPGEGIPDYLYLLGTGEMAFLLWKDGSYLCLDLNGSRLPRSYGSLKEARVVEKGNVFQLLSDSPKGNEQARITSTTILLGRGTIVIGDTLGRVSSWHLGRKKDQLVLINSHLFSGTAKVTSLVPSTRKRLLAVGYSDGSLRVFYLTSERLLAQVQTFSGSPIDQVLLAPKDDGVGALGADGILSFYRMKEGYPEVSFKALFAPILYEGNAKAEHVWQSSSGTDSFEPKFGLVPLIFGTLKATFYSLLFGVPIALMAAIYTSEFLHPDLRARIKPLIEMMASLPSVVLGFLAALVVAPFVENRVPTVLFCVFSFPFAFLISGYLVQFLSRRWFIRISWYRFVLLLLVSLPLGILMALWGGPWMERILFHGDLKSWLDGQVGRGTPGWVLLFLPLSVLGSGIFIRKILYLPRIRTWVERLERGQSYAGQRYSKECASEQSTRVQQKPKPLSPAAIDLLKLMLGGILSLSLAVGVAFLLDRIGLDSRAPFPVFGRLMGTYVQRNSLVVGFLMGFAIIPIIYTLADDALKSVPNSLRSAALSLGATPWQTTVRVVVPTAMSGLFSAAMIGFGRAVGETMIVLMAAGNTPIMEWNPFNGFRTLSANIAVELPEAVVGSTHYRILFLAALTLFVLTFIVNTIAEIQRMRFRARAYQL